MPLRLITGPANAEKARVVLGGVRAAAPAGPLLVVPRGADTHRFRRELAAGGTVFGVRVTTFAGLADEVAARAGLRAPLLGPVARERVGAGVVQATRLDVLAQSARTPGFAAALGALWAELEAARVEPGRLARALADLSAATGRDPAYGRELAALYRGWRGALERLHRTDRELRDARALDVLATEPARWGTTPVFIYGFDDLTPAECDALLVLGRITEVTASLPYEPGRAAFAGRATTFETLRPEATVEELPAREEHYAPTARATLHHLERGLFEPDAGRRAPGEALTLLEGGGERAELELVAAEVHALLTAGVPGEEIAVVVRRPAEAAPLLEQVFAALEVPIALERRVGLGRTALGRALLGLLRAALAGGDAGDLLAWLRAPGSTGADWPADRLERRVRRDGLRSVAAARSAWEADGGRALWELDALGEAARRGPRALLTVVGERAQALFAGEWRGRAPLLTAPELVDARALGAVRDALGELEGLAGATATPSLLGTPADIIAALEALEVDASLPAPPEAVAVTDPLAVRARRVRALFVTGLQEGAFPPAPRPEPFLPDDARHELAVHTGLALRRRGDELGGERYFFYALASRPEERLILSWHAATDDGDPAVRSFFVDDVCDLFDAGAVEARTRRRPLGAVDWPAGQAPTPREAARGAALAGPRRRPAVLGPLRDRGVLEALDARGWSGTGLETLAGCGVRWFVERWLRPGSIEPDPEPMVRGSLAHRLLEEILRDLAAGAPRPLRPDDLPAARAALRRALDEHAAAYPISHDAQRLRAHLRRLEADLDRLLAYAVGAGSAFAPAHFEVAFGREDDPLPPLDLGEGLRLHGTIDRVDVDGAGRALVYDYKGRVGVPGAGWIERRALQVGLYLRAAQQLLSLDPVGGFYQAYRDDELRPRGAVIEGADPALATVNGDAVDEATFRALLDDVVAVAREAVAELRTGTLAARPASCAFGDGGCAHPTICRTETAA